MNIKLKRLLTLLIALVVMLPVLGAGVAYASGGAAPAGASPNLPGFFLLFAIDLVAMLLVAYFLYYRRHGRRDLLMAYIAFNVGVFLVMTVISVTATNMGVGFGLFAILSIIRIRSEPFSNMELGYFFIALVISVINALGVGGSAFTLTNEALLLSLNVAAVLVMYVMDHPALQRGASHVSLTLDVVHKDEQSLKTDLEQRLNARVVSYTIAHIDYVKDVTELEVRYVNSPPSEQVPTLHLQGAGHER